LSRVEEILRDQGGGHGEALAEAAAMTLEAGGKRLRPMLVLLCAGEAGDEGAVSAAAAIELIHMATLVHDDVLDAAPLRRGRPTVAASAGRERATATGDLLFSRAFALLAGAGEPRPIELLATASVALARGELMQRQDAYDTGVSEDRYLERCRLKTAALFECACRLGRDSEPLGEFGAAIGLAFQLLDDVLDVSGPPERTGKARGTDLLDGTVTLPMILAGEHDPELLSVDLRSLDPAAAVAFCDRIEASGVLRQVRSRALAAISRMFSRSSSCSSRVSASAPSSSASSNASISSSPWMPSQRHSHSGQRRQRRQWPRLAVCSQRVGCTRLEPHAAQT
jgi:geranylgeranyl pyrophosphate synthase